MATIQFFSIADFIKREGKVESDYASGRYRVLIPASQLAQRGHSVSVGTIPADPGSWIDIASISADIVVFSKSLNSHNEALVKALRARGVHVIFDLCDDYFDNNSYGAIFKSHTIEMCKLANNVVTSTPLLGDLVRQHAGVKATTIVDPVEGVQGQPGFAPQLPNLKLLWFGHDSNWNAMLAEIPLLADLGKVWPLELRVITKLGPKILKTIEYSNKEYASRLSIALTPWTRDAIWPAFKQCDLVIIPTRKTDFHAAKSANRLTESLWAGRAVVAHPLQAYREYSNYAFLSDDIVRGIRQAVETGAATQSRIMHGQNYINSVNSPATIGGAWERIMGLASS